MKALTYFGILGLTLGCPWTALDAQSTSIDLTTQGRLRVGTQLPQSCRTGQIFLVTSNAQWPVLFVCSAGAWSSPGLPSLDSDGEGKVMRWNAETSQWTAAGLADSAGLGIAFTGPTLSVEDAIVPMYYAGSGAPSMDCVRGRDFYVDTDGGALHFCKAPGQWQQAANSAHTHSADALTSGTLAVTLMPATVARRDVTNAFTAGQRQSMGHDSSNAGLRLIPAAGDPTIAQDGDLWYNSSTNRFRRKQNGSISDWDSTASGVSLSQPNTFSAGQRQSMGHDSSNAGLRLIPAAGDPSVAQDGDLWYNSSTNRFRRKQNGSVSDWDSTGGGVSLSQPNTFSAGQRQSMGHDSSSAGLRLIPAAGDPSVAQDGDLWYNSSTNRFRRKQNGNVSDWDSGGGVSLSQPNTFSAGQRQSMGHDSSNAGLRLIPAAGDPSAAQDGDLWYNSSTNRFRRMQNGSVSDWDSSGAGGGGSTINFLDRSNFWMIEDFTPSGTAAAGAQYQGTYRWVLVQIGAGGCAQTGTANGNSNSPGLLALVAPGTANTGCDVALDGDNDNKLTSNLVSKTWYAEWTFLPDLASSSVVARVGIGGSTGVAASISAVSCRIDPASSPNYLFDLHTSGTLTRSVDSGVAYSADGATHTCRIRGDGAKWYFAIANGAGAYSSEKTLCPSGCDLAAALPTFAVTPFASVTTTNTSLKRIYLDRFAMVIQGLVR